MRDTVQDLRFVYPKLPTNNYSLPTVLAAKVEEFHIGDGLAKKLAAKTGEFIY